MIQLINSLSSWGTSDFEKAVKQEVGQMSVEQLPLQQGLSLSSYAVDSNLKVIVICVAEKMEFIRVKVGIFYTGLIMGCGCADDPAPLDEYNEYCEVQLDINKKTADTIIKLLNS